MGLVLPSPASSPDVNDWSRRVTRRFPEETKVERNSGRKCWLPSGSGASNRKAGRWVTSRSDIEIEIGEIWNACASCQKLCQLRLVLLNEPFSFVSQVVCVGSDNVSKELPVSPVNACGGITALCDRSVA